LTIHGLTPGYSLFTANRGVIFPFILALFFANIAFLIIGLLGARYFAMVSLTPQNILSSVVLLLSTVGCYAVRGNVLDVVSMLIFGAIGYLLKLYKFNIVPIVLGMILGDIAEESLQQALLLHHNSLGLIFKSFFCRPISIGLMVLIVVSIVFPLVSEYSKSHSKEAAV